MALADPQSITFDGSKTLPRTQSSPFTSTYVDLPNGLTLQVKHDIKGRKRSQVRIVRDKVAADPLTSVNQKVSASVYLMVDGPLTGFSVTELKDQITALVTWISASTYANTIKVLQEEH